MEETWHEVLDVRDDLEVGQLLRSKIGPRHVCIGRSVYGFFAVDDDCPHAAGSLSEGLLDGVELICPVHAWVFNVESGECPDEPGCQLPVYEIAHREGRLAVRLPVTPASRDGAAPRPRPT